MRTILVAALLLATQCAAVAPDRATAAPAGERPPDRAGDPCLAQLARLPVRERVRVRTFDGETVAGELLAVDPAAHALRLRVAAGEAPGSERRLAFESVRQLQHSRPGRVQPRSMIVGLVAGAALGLAVGWATTPGSSEESGIAALAGMTIGAGAGLTVGLVLPLTGGRSHTIRCGEEPR